MKVMQTCQAIIFIKLVSSFYSAFFWDFEIGSIWANGWGWAGGICVGCSLANYTNFDVILILILYRKTKRMFAYKNVQLFFLLMQLSLSSINFLGSYRIKNSAGNVTYGQGYGSTFDYIMMSVVSSPQNEILVVIPNSGSSPLTFKTKVVSGIDSSLYIYHPKSTNKFSTINSKFIRFNATVCRRFRNLNVAMPDSQEISPTNSIKECTFVETGPEYITVYQDVVTSILNVSVFDQKSVIINSSVFVWATTAAYFQYGLEKTGLFYMLFKDGICICRSDATLTQVKRVTWPLATNPSMDVNFGILAYSHDLNATILNVTNNFTPIFNLSLTQPIHSIKIYSMLQILLLTPSGIYQYNILTGKLVSSVAYQFSYYNSIDVVLGKYIVIYCRRFYYFSSLLFFDSVPDNAVAINYANSNTNPNSTALPVDAVSAQQIQEELRFIDEAFKYSLQFSIDLGFVMYASSSKTASKPLMLLIMILDDLEYYQYHKINYTQATEFVIFNINALNQIRFSSWFLNGTRINEKLKAKLAAQESLYSNQFAEDDKNPSQFYFLNSSKSAYVDNLFMCVFFFLTMKVFSLLFYCIRNQHKIFMTMNKWLGRNTRWWMLLVAILQNNMAGLTFDAFVQLQGPMVSFFNFENKVNLTITVLTLFGLLLYALCFYLLIYTYSPRKVAKTLLSHSKSVRCSFFWESFSRITRNLIRCFFHGYFIFNYKMQIVGLAWSNILYVVPTIILRKSFHSSITFLFFLIYYLVFFAFDVSLALNFLVPDLFKSVNFNLLTFICICILIAIGLSLLISSIISTMIRVVKKIFFNNPINEDKDNIDKIIDPTKPDRSKKLIILLPATKVSRTAQCQQKQGYKLPLKQNNYKTKKQARTNKKMMEVIFKTHKSHHQHQNDGQNYVEHENPKAKGKVFKLKHDKNQLFSETGQSFHQPKPMVMLMRHSKQEDCQLESRK